jgi:hypothetical protein
MLKVSYMVFVNSLKHKLRNMKSLNVEILMGHDIGLADSYYRPSEQELLTDYLQSIDLLTIHNDRSKLEKQVKELKEKSTDTDSVIKARLQEKDEIIESMKVKYDHELILMKSAINDMQNLLKHPAKLTELGT